MKKLCTILTTIVSLGAWSLPSYAQSIVGDIGPELAEIRKHTAKYHRVENALADGYQFFPVAGTLVESTLYVLASRRPTTGRRSPAACPAYCGWTNRKVWAT